MADVTNDELIGQTHVNKTIKILDSAMRKIMKSKGQVTTVHIFIYHNDNATNADKTLKDHKGKVQQIGVC